MENITIPLKEWQNLIKNSIKLTLISRDLEFAKKQNKLLKEQREELRDDVRFYMNLWKSADARAGKIARSIYVQNRK